MRPISATYTTTGIQTAVGLDWQIVPFSVSYAITKGGSPTFSLTVDHTYDNLNDPSITPVWFAGTAVTDAAEGVFTAPVQFIRVNIASLSGGTVTLKVLQGESIN